MDLNRSISERLLALDNRKKAGVVAGALSVVVACGAVFAFAGSGSTKTGAAYCGYDDHEHVPSCYAAPMVCDVASSGAIVLHSHDESCYGPGGKLVCELPERFAHEHTDACYQSGGGHYEHDESCYSDVKTLMCDKEEIPQHTHDVADGCYDEAGNLICEKTETHSHGPACYDEDGNLVCEKPEVLVHVHNDQECYKIDYHVLTCTRPLDSLEDVVRHEHGPACYETVYGEELICGFGDAHVHTADCYGPKDTGHVHTVDCYEPVEKHEHDDSCYEEIPGALICDKAETEGHKHTDGCYPVERKLTCTLDESDGEAAALICGKDGERTLVCGLEESEGHTHTDACMDADGNVVCGLEEYEGHTHGADCYVTHVHGAECFSEAVEGHHHDESCYSDVKGSEPVCGLEETEAHEHGEGCYAAPEKKLVCTVATDDGHVHDDSCHATVRGALTCTEDHVHDDSCYESVDILTCENRLVCGEMGRAEHVHDASCRIDVRGDLICDIEESEDHEHTDACYEMVPVMLCESELICGHGDDAGHVHNELCHPQEAVLVCGKTAGEPEAPLTCGKEELVPHTHDASCYMDTAEMHVHDEGCYTEIDGDRVLTCGQLAASDCEDAGNGRVLACGKPEVIVHRHVADCFGEPDLSGEPACGLHVHTAECYKDPNKTLFGSGDAGSVTCPKCGAENIHVHVAGSEICGEQAAEPVAICGKDHEHVESCWTYYPDCKVGGHVCGGDAVDGDGETDADIDVGSDVVYEDYEFEGDGFVVKARVPDTVFEIPVTLKAERLEPGSEGWLAYMEAIGADPDDDRYMLVADIWFVDASDESVVVAPATDKGRIDISVVARDDDGYENEVSAGWGDDVFEGDAIDAGDVSEADAIDVEDVSEGDAIDAGDGSVDDAGGLPVEPSVDDGGFETGMEPVIDEAAAGPVPDGDIAA